MMYPIPKSTDEVIANGVGHWWLIRGRSLLAELVEEFAGREGVKPLFVLMNAPSDAYRFAAACSRRFAVEEEVALMTHFILRERGPGWGETRRAVKKFWEIEGEKAFTRRVVTLLEDPRTIKLFEYTAPDEAVEEFIAACRGGERLEEEVAKIAYGLMVAGFGYWPDQTE